MLVYSFERKSKPRVSIPRFERHSWLSVLLGLITLFFVLSFAGFAAPRVALLSEELGRNWLPVESAVPTADVLLILGGDKDRELLLLQRFADGTLVDEGSRVRIPSDIPVVISSGVVSQEDIDSIKSNWTQVKLDHSAIDTLTNFSKMGPKFKRRNIKTVAFATSDYHFRRSLPIGVLSLGALGLRTIGVCLVHSEPPTPSSVIETDHSSDISGFLAQPRLLEGLDMRTHVSSVQQTGLHRYSLPVMLNVTLPLSGPAKLAEKESRPRPFTEVVTSLSHVKDSLCASREVVAVDSDKRESMRRCMRDWGRTLVWILTGWEFTWVTKIVHPWRQPVASD